MREHKQDFVQGFVKGFNDALDTYTGSLRVIRAFGKVLEKGSDVGLAVLANRELRAHVTASVTVLGSQLFDEGINLIEKVEATGIKEKLESYIHDAKVEYLR